jgi:hypothetical protein
VQHPVRRDKAPYLARYLNVPPARHPGRWLDLLDDLYRQTPAALLDAPWTGSGRRRVRWYAVSHWASHRRDVYRQPGSDAVAKRRLAARGTGAAALLRAGASLGQPLAPFHRVSSRLCG